MKAHALTLYEIYTRQDVHDIFEPGTRFTPQAGTWGLWGIVPVPGKAGDFVFFVTFGKEQAGHHFDEWVSRNGIINWQSQPRQGLADRQIQQFIQHDPTKNNIYLFLRTNKSVPYTYLGRLAYHAHDPKRERPVYIQWQILDWNPPLAHLQAMGLTLRLEEPQPAPESADNVSFEWRGVQYQVDLDHLRSIVRHHMRAGLPAEALRFRDWYVEMEGQRVSAKWLFHLLTNADYNEFDAPTARDKLEKIGIQSHPVPEAAEPVKTVQFAWKDKVYRYDAQQLHGALHKRVQDGLPEDALRFNKWYLSAAGQAISPKWVFHRLTKTDYEQFTTQQARDKVLQLELPVFYQASPLDIQRGCTVILTPSNSVVEDAHPAHQAFAQAFASKVNSVFRNGKLLFPNSQNQREVHYGLADLGQGFLRQNKNGGLEFSFEFSNAHEPPDALRQKLVPLVSEAQKVLGYPVFVNKLEKDAWRVGSEIIEIDAWFPLFDGLGEEKLDGKNVPAHWDAFYQKVRQAHPQSQWEDIADTLFGMALAEFVNAVAPIIQQAIQLTKPAKDADGQLPLPEIKMGKKRNYIGSTIRRLTDLILDLAQLGEIGPEALSNYGLGDSHVLQLVQSSWAISTPYALVATPHLLNVLPVQNQEELNQLLHLSTWDYQGWGNFDQKAFHLSASPRYPQLDFRYIYTSKPAAIAQDTLWRPVWLVNYLPDDDWDDWEIANLMHAPIKQREAKLYVHSTIPIQNIYGGLAEAQEAVWKTAFYWLMLQLIILSDPQTGATYDPRISLTLSNGWREDSRARLFLQGEYLGDLVDCLETMLARFRWVWVNRANSVEEDQGALLGLLRLLLKIEVAELGKDGQVQFTDAYRSQLFESQAKARLQYINSREARDQLREAIKEMSR